MRGHLELRVMMGRVIQVFRLIKVLILTSSKRIWLRVLRVHLRASSEFKEAGVIEEIEEECNHFEGR